ncbi:hypothetical protein BDW62DRAFT_199891 [Aspergillus aurantiobrunneus]
MVEASHGSRFRAWVLCSKGIDSEPARLGGVFAASCVYAFSEANKHCNAASNRARFQEIRLKVKTRQGLDDDVRQWHKILHKNFAFGSVRHLSVEGRVAPFWENAETSTPAALMERSCSEHRCEDELTHPGVRYDHILRGPFYHLGVQEEQSERAWMPLAGLLAKLTGLRDLVYACERRLPECLLKALECQIPRCQLHIKAFDPPSLTREKQEDEGDVDEDEDDAEEEAGDNDDDDGVDGYDYALATSSFLSTVVVPVAYDDNNRNDNEEAVRLMARGLAPNLKHVHVVDSGPGFRYRPITRGLSKKGLLSKKKLVRDIRQKNPGLGQLEGLSLEPANLTRFEMWEKTISLSCLRNLRLWRVHKDILRKATKCDFTSLKTLALSIFNSRGQYDVSSLDRAAGVFIASLPPLEAIHVSGPFFKKPVRAILDHHGNSLRKLCLSPSNNRDLAHITTSPSIIRQIRQRCTNICDVRLRILRTAGDQEEQEVYRALGELPKLRQLSLELDVFNLVKIGGRLPWKLESSHVRNIFINMAIDARLAREIFCLIANDSPIESLELNLGIDYVVELSDIAQTMARQWKCSRFSSTCPEDSRVIVQELGGKSRKLRVQANQTIELGEYEETFRNLWPSTTGDWKSDWHSFPLQGEGDQSEGTG